MLQYMFLLITGLLSFPSACHLRFFHQMDWIGSGISNLNLCQSAASEPSISVIDEDGKSHRITATMILKLARRKVVANDHDNKVEFEGTLLVDLLQSLGVIFG